MYDTYPVEFMMKEVMGFGKSLDDDADCSALPGVDPLGVGARHQPHRLRARRRARRDP